jgi:activator of HSP90 ATPase
MVQFKNEMSKVGEMMIPAPIPRRALLCVAGAVLATPAFAAVEKAISHTAESIHQEPVFRASRKRIYDVLTDTRQFAKIVELSGAMHGMPPGTKAAEISREAGGAFTIFGGLIVGRQVELVPDQRIVQAWRVVDWKPGDYSIAKFELTEQGAAETKLVFDHTGFPHGTAEHLAAGWEEHYWGPLRKFLA